MTFLPGHHQIWLHSEEIMFECTKYITEADLVKKYNYKEEEIKLYEEIRFIRYSQFTLQEYNHIHLSFKNNR